MKTMQDHNCYISASYSTDLTKITRFLQDEGIKPIIASEISHPGDIVRSIKKEISKSDFVLGVLDEKSNSSNVFVELGIAIANNKQVLVIAPPSIKETPYLLGRVSWIRTDIDNLDAIKFHIRQTISHLNRKKKVRKISKNFPEKTESSKIKTGIKQKTDIKQKTISKKYKPIGRLSKKLIQELESIPNEEMKEIFLIKILHEAIKTSGVSVIVESNTPEGRIDLSIWADYFNGIIGNPFPIEVKKIINSKTIKGIQNQFTRYFEKSGSQFGMVIYLDDPTEEIYRIKEKMSTVFFIQIKQFLRMLEEESFVDIVINLRNSKVHGGDYGKNFSS